MPDDTSIYTPFSTDPSRATGGFVYDTNSGIGSGAASDED